MRTCEGCPEREIKVFEDGKVYVCKSDCKDYKVRKMMQLLENKKKSKEYAITQSIIDNVIKTKRKLRNKWGNQNGN